MASFSDIFKAVPRALRRRRSYNDEGLPGSADPSDPTTPAALPAPVVRRRRVETLSPEVDADAANRAAGIDPATGRLMRAPRRDEYGQNLEGAQGYSDDLAAYRPEDHNGRLKSIGLGLLRGFAGGGLGGLVAGGISHGVDPSLDEKYAKRVALSQAEGEIGRRYGMAKADSDLQNEDVERKLRIAQAIKAMREPETNYHITATDTGIVGIDPHDPTKIVETGLRPPKRPESQNRQTYQRRNADGSTTLMERNPETGKWEESGVKSAPSQDYVTIPGYGRVPAGAAYSADRQAGRQGASDENAERAQKFRDYREARTEQERAVKEFNAAADEFDKAFNNAALVGNRSDYSDEDKAYAATKLDEARAKLESLKTNVSDEHAYMGADRRYHMKERQTRPPRARASQPRRNSSAPRSTSRKPASDPLGLYK